MTNPTPPAAPPAEQRDFHPSHSRHWTGTEVSPGTVALAAVCRHGCGVLAGPQGITDTGVSPCRAATDR